MSAASQAVSVTIEQAEGTTPLPPPITVTGANIWAQAQGVLATLGQIDCEPDMLGVRKTDFTIVWADGQDYTGTFGLTRTDNDLAAHVRHFLATDPATLRRLGHSVAFVDAFVTFGQTHTIGDPDAADVLWQISRTGPDELALTFKGELVASSNDENLPTLVQMIDTAPDALTAT